MNMSTKLVLVMIACATAGHALEGNRAVGQVAPSSLHADADGLDLVPWPQSVERAEGELALTDASRIVVEDAPLRPLAQVLAEEVHAVTGLSLAVANSPARPGDVVLRRSDRLAAEAYTLRVADTATVEAGGYAGAASATATLLQLFEARPDGATLPRATIEDRPESAYRGLLIDVARRYHSIDTLRQCVQLCRLYKIRYLQLHLTDDQAFTFPSQAYPRLSANTWHGGPAYTLDELCELEAYAAARGVVIVPEFEVPGHAGAMNRAMPELFKIRGTKPYEHHATINFVNADVLRAVDTIVGEMCRVFRSSPYFHIGGDEADCSLVHQHQEFQAELKRLGLGERGQRQLYRRFLIQMNEIVRRHGKQMIVWEGFHRDRKSPFQIPKDVIVMEYECPFYRPAHLVEDGYTVINACWTPLYVVKKKRWTPEQIYGWNLYRFGQHTARYSQTTWHQLEPTPRIIGAQMCAWEQPEAIEISSLRTRLPAMSERIWHKAAGKTYTDFARRAARTDAVLSRLIPTVRIQATGLSPADPDTYDVSRFSSRATVSLRSELPAAEIRYTLDGQMPVSSVAASRPAESPAPHSPRPTSSMTYQEPFVIEKTTTVRAAAFDADGKPVRHPSGEVFYREEDKSGPP